MIARTYSHVQHIIALLTLNWHAILVSSGLITTDSKKFHELYIFVTDMQHMIGLSSNQNIRIIKIWDTTKFRWKTWHLRNPVDIGSYWAILLHPSLYFLKFLVFVISSCYLQIVSILWYNLRIVSWRKRICSQCIKGLTYVVYKLAFEFCNPHKKTRAKWIKLLVYISGFREPAWDFANITKKFQSQLLNS